MQGRAGYVPKADGGSIFYLELPLQAAQAPPVATDSTGAGQGEFSGHVLVAEDDRINQKVIRAALHKLGLRVTLAADGPTALELALRGGIDLILLDLQMPGLDGLEVWSRLQASDTALDIPVYALTASTDEELRKTCLDRGIRSVLGKPLVSSELHAVLRAHVGARSYASAG